MTQDQNSANQQNANHGTSGTNLQYDKAQANKGKQMNSNQSPKGSSKGKGGKPSTTGKPSGKGRDNN
jgi:hypothetical protein